MNYEVQECEFEDGEWVAEAIGSDGEIYFTLFSGPLAKERAIEYAAWKNGEA